MKATKNTYHYPVEMTKDVEMTYDKSPAHIGRLQYAIDFIVPEGTPVLAAAAGIVVDVKQDSNIGGDDESFDMYGNYIEVKHDYNEYSIYEHIAYKGSLVQVGDTVTAGQVIGYSGKTGWIAHCGPHLHFDVHHYSGNSKEVYRALKITWIKK